ncbi:class I SAM-dependent methyltransferase [Vibrio paucivorans]
MIEQYSDEVSRHYAAYRPPIHSKILARALAQQQGFQQGLDIGCGTGVSSEALNEFCQRVVGLEPSEAMLSQVSPNNCISYVLGSGDAIPLGDHVVDIVSFAGSLPYAKSSQLVSELTRVCASHAFIVVYDFEVQLGEFMSLLGVMLQPRKAQYNHSENFDGYSELAPVQTSQEKLSLVLTPKQLAHVLFSSARRYSAIVERFGSDNTFNTVVDVLKSASREHKVSVDTYYSSYRLSK